MRIHPPHIWTQMSSAPNPSARPRLLPSRAPPPIERAVGAAISGVAPNPLLWGRLSAEEFLLVLRDVTTWSLTHFEPVRAWCAAEDLTIVEEQEGYGMVGRIRRLTQSDYPEKRAVRALQDVVNPKVRDAALWVARALMSVIHPDASDPPTGVSPQERQATRLRRCVPEGRRWLADRQRHWPRTYFLATDNPSRPDLPDRSWNDGSGRCQCRWA